MKPVLRFYILLLSINVLSACVQSDQLEVCKTLIWEYEYDEAEKKLKNIVKEDSTNADALALLLRVYSLSNDTSSVDSLRDLLTKKETPTAFIALGTYFYDSRYFARADSQFTKLLPIAGFGEIGEEWSKKCQKGIQADELSSAAFRHMNQGQVDSVLILCKKAISIWEELGHPHAHLFDLKNIAYAQAIGGDFEAAESSIRRSLQVAKKTGDRSLRSAVLMYWGIIKDLRGDYPAAIEKFKQAHKFATLDKRVEFEIGSLGNMASSQKKLGKILDAKETFLEILSLAQRVGRQRDENVTYYFLGEVCKDLGQYEEAIEYLNKARQLAVERADHLLEASALDVISGLYYFRSEYEIALDYGLQAESIYESVNHTRNKVNRTIQNSLLLTALARYDEAKKIAKQAVQIVGDLGFDDLLVSAKYAMAQNYQSQGEYELAVAKLEECFQDARRIKSFAKMAGIATSMANCYRELKTVPQSTAQLDTLIIKADSLGMKKIATSARLALARILLDTKRADEVAKLCDEVIEAARTLHDPETLAEAFITKGDISYMLEDWSQAEIQYEQAANTQKQRIGGLMVGANRAHAFDQLRDITEKQISTAYRLEDYYGVFELAEKAKARTFHGLIAHRDFNLVSQTDTSSLKEVKRLREEMADLSSQLAMNVSEGTTRSRRNERAYRISKELRRTTEQYSELLYKLEIANPWLGSVLSEPEISVEDVQVLLPSNSLLLQYVVLDEQLLIVALGAKKAPHVFSVPYSRAKLRRDISFVVGQIREEYIEQTGWRDMAQHLCKILFDSVSVAGLLDFVETLIVLPDDALVYLPFQMLVDNEEFLVEKYAIINYPSASIMKLIQDSAATLSVKRILAVGYSDPSAPIEFAENEARAIKRLFGDSVTLIVNKWATEDTVLKVIENHDLIHLAAHGVSTTRDPLLFAMRFAPTEKNDGFLQVHEIFGLRLKKNSLVVLSGCETGAEKGYRFGVSPGAEVIGLLRAFLYAGATSVISTLWSIDDPATAEFMKIFYSELQQTRDIALALKTTQNTIRTNPRLSHPYFWAPFILTGTTAISESPSYSHKF